MIINNLSIASSLNIWHGKADAAYTILQIRFVCVWSGFFHIDRSSFVGFCFVSVSLRISMVEILHIHMYGMGI